MMDGMAEPSGSPAGGTRRPRWSVLHAALSPRRRRRPAAVVVSGELGVGKTRLVAEFLAQADVERLRRRLRAGRRRAAAVRRPDPGPAQHAARAWSGRRSRLARARPAAAGRAGAPGRHRARRPATGSRLRLFQAVLGLLGRLCAAPPGRPCRRGRALGRPVDARPAGVPGHEPHRRTGAGGPHPPRRTSTSRRPAGPVAGRARPAVARRTAAAGPARPRRTRPTWSTGLRGERRRSQACSADVRGAFGRQPAVRRAAGADRAPTGTAAPGDPARPAPRPGRRACPDETRARSWAPPR